MKRKKRLRHQLKKYAHIQKKMNIKDLLVLVSIVLNKIIENMLFSLYTDCPLDSAYITLMNRSSNSAVDVSRWNLIRYVDSKLVFQHKISDDVQLNPGSELRIYSKVDTEIAETSPNELNSSLSKYQKKRLNGEHATGMYIFIHVTKYSCTLI